MPVQECVNYEQMKSLMLASSILWLLWGCATKVTPPVNTAVPKEFSKGEVILAHQLLTKIFDQEMAPLPCVEDTDEASLLLRTLNPRMELVQDDIEATLDDRNEVATLIQTCDQNCTCSFLDDLLREHLVVITKEQRAALEAKKKMKDLNSCLSYIQATFCQSDIYRTLSQEKAEFSFE
jgi:hypothetical protein